MSFPTRQTISASIFLFFAFLFLAGCQTRHVAYHSTAGVPYVTDATNTQMNLVGGGDEMAGEREYIVFAAVDGQDTAAAGYVLLAPARGGSRSRAGYSFANANLERAVPLRGEVIESLASGLRRASNAWNRVEARGEGTFVEVVHAPGQPGEQPAGENAARGSHPAFRFTFSRTPDGPSARMLLGPGAPEGTGRPQYVIEFDRREQISDFRDVLEAARDRAIRMAGQQ